MGTVNIIVHLLSPSPPPLAVRRSAMTPRPISGRVPSVLAAATTAAALLALSACSTAQKDISAGMSTDKLRAEAQEEASGGNFDRAAKLYEKLEGRASGTVLGQQAQLERAWLLYRANDKATALSVLDRFIRLNPSSAGLDYALYLQGLINFNDNLGFMSSLSRQDLSERDQQAARDSYRSFRQLVEQFPQSVYAADAQMRMNYIVNSLATYELHVARYYFRRGAYVAAANRAQQTVREFQQSPAAREALAIMVQSYDRLGLVELRDDAERVLKHNFPEAAAADLGGMRRKAWWQFW
jgi:outer membrane protein assembly factor BamD